jgi:homoserine acetyltransferase
VFQWTVSHPRFMDKAVSIVGSQKSQPDDRQRWNDGIRWLGDPAWTRAREMLSRGKPLAALNELWVKPCDNIRQAHAITALDITHLFGGSMERTAAAIKADLMVVGTWKDLEVNPSPAFELARFAGAEISELDGRCGHQAPSCERATVWRAVVCFLDR